MIRLIGISLVLINLVACQDFASEIEVNKCPTVTSAQTFKLDEVFHLYLDYLYYSLYKQIHSFQSMLLVIGSCLQQA